MSAVESTQTVILGDLASEETNVSLATSNPGTGLVATALAATLLVGTSHTFSGCEAWSFDKYMNPGLHEYLGSGDTIVVYRHFYNSFLSPGPLPLPIFSASLSHITAWGNADVQFSIRLLSTGDHHPRTITLPRSIVCFSILQHLQRFLWPFPRLYSIPSPVTLHAAALKQAPGSRALGDRVPRDSDDLPIWDTRRVRA
ncbi:hypothetical protein F4604DRAFT_1930187 [Suillus subluteus]|nr:hypothetical protein F4604DRAFT_1930187 [Suillus subluteus]